MNVAEQSLILLLAALVDYLVGDPETWLHPVQVMGWMISLMNQLIIKFFSNPYLRRCLGVILALSLIVGSGLSAVYLIIGANIINPLLSIVIQIILLASCFALRSLRRAASEVLTPLNANLLTESRQQLSKYVGRDTQNLNAEEISRAVLETVAENTTDGVTAPLFYALLGAFIPGVGCVPLALAYKAASTLDSMIGYRREPYKDLGWFSAKLDDCLTWVPCRLTVLTLGLLSKRPLEVWSICRRDGIKDPSPNSGWSECVYAAILQVQLGGINTYKGVVTEKPLLGDAIEPITPDKIEQALQLSRYCFLLWLFIGIIGLSFSEVFT